MFCQLESVDEIDVNPAFYKSSSGRIDGRGKKGFGPFYYGDTNIYGAQLDSHGNPQPYPHYQNFELNPGTGFLKTRLCTRIFE